MAHQFVENVNFRAVQWLNTQVTSEMVALYSTEEEKTNYSFVKKILQSFMKGRGSIKVTYKPSQFDPDSCFRVYSSGGIQQLPNQFRGLLCNGISTDVDIVNCQPTIIYNLCKRHNIECPFLTKYVHERDQLIADGKITKLDATKVMNKEKYTKGLTSYGIGFDNEMKFLQRELAIHYPRYLQLAEQKAKDNKMGRFMSYLYQKFENDILQAVVEKCPYKISVLMFDGFLIEGLVPETYCDELSAFVKEKFDMEIKYKLKPHNTSLVIPDDYHFEDNETQYLTLKTKYEAQGLCYIESTSSYALKINNKYMFKSRDELTRHFERETIGDDPFFLKWVKDPTAQVFQDIGMYPHDVKCPDGILNLWTGFSAFKLNTELVDIEPFHEHVRIMANREDAVYHFLIKWMANMFQFPSSPSIFVCLSSNEGTGKSALMQLLTNMVGHDKSIEIDSPETQLFGTFNGHLQDKIFINLNEIGRKDMNQFYDKLKSAINSPTCVVHDKGQKAFSINNIRHYFATTNNEHAIIVKDGNRRYMMAQTSNELIGKHDYHTAFYNWIERPSVQYSIYHYLMNLPNIPKKFVVNDIPITNVMREAYELNKDPIEDFMLTFEDGVDSDALYFQYKQYMRQHGYDGTITSKSFIMKFSKYKDKYNIVVKKIDNVVEGQRMAKRIYSRVPPTHQPPTDLKNEVGGTLLIE
jgi:hypothetical protein